ncbi:hypothetical protein JQ633_24190 [Bradyrhizobium tropiciagri]|uniref:hypothetical protein n=1 Tax=Bradyrhizobium tropiciagri TaxID=312253 RepID=UPI001BA6D0F1|nr:hypothetical protein [Bradyrhizobium tropiciagri]MBR0873479.1 hypothetical protein [Bradyrhizobium tropiciagri]
MRTLILAATAVALLSSTALAQDKAGASPAPAAQSADTTTKGEASKMAPKKKAKKTAAKKSSAKKGDDAAKQ